MVTSLKILHVMCYTYFLIQLHQTRRTDGLLSPINEFIHDLEGLQGMNPHSVFLFLFLWVVISIPLMVLWKFYILNLQSSMWFSLVVCFFSCQEGRNRVSSLPKLLLGGLLSIFQWLCIYFCTRSLRCWAIYPDLLTFVSVPGTRAILRTVVLWQTPVDGLFSQLMLMHWECLSGQCLLQFMN